ncbi:MAG: glycoside hydrolase family 15 protein [Hyphomonadaceae bacterium]
MTNHCTLDLAPIGNCAASALVDRHGRFVWACAPRVDGDPLFSALLSGRDATETTEGIWAIDLIDCVKAEQTYDRNTPILITRLTDKRGAIIELVDFCPRYRRFNRVYRPLAFARIVRPISGAPRIRVRLTPTRDWGRTVADVTSGSNHIRYLAGAVTMRLSTTAPVSHIVGAREFRLENDLTFFLGPDEPFNGDVAAEVRAMHDNTKDYWRQWTRGLATPLEWQAEVIRAAIALKLCVHEETGAIVAALTTSIPEAANSGRNWDYRFCWLRDAYYTVQALNRLGARRCARRLSQLSAQHHRLHAQRPHPARVRRRHGADPAGGDRRYPRRLSRHGPGARRQSGARASPARCVRSDRARPHRPSTTRASSAPMGWTISTHSKASASAHTRCIRRRTQACGSSARARRSTRTPR